MIAPTLSGFQRRDFRKHRLRLLNFESRNEVSSKPNLNIYIGSAGRSLPLIAIDDSVIRESARRISYNNYLYNTLALVISISVVYRQLRSMLS